LRSPTGSCGAFTGELMADAVLPGSRGATASRAVRAWDRLKADRNWLSAWFMLPAAAFLIPRLSVFNTILYTVVASVIKFAVGLYLAMLLNQNMPLKAIIRAIVLIPFIVPTVLSAIAFWWLYDSQFSILSWSLRQLHLISSNINFLGDPWNARWSVIFANIWRGVPFVAITLLAGLQTVPPSLYEAATIDGASRWQIFRHVTYPMLTPIIAVVMTFSVLFTFTDFQLIWAMTRGGPVNATHLMATLSYQRAIGGGYLGEGAAIATAMIPFLLAAILISWFGLQRRKWQHGESND
jgi:multiple sugar transport system permease protein